MFLSKPPRDSLPVFSARSFASNRQLALVESVEEEKKFHERMYRTQESISGPLAYEADTLLTELSHLV